MSYEDLAIAVLWQGVNDYRASIKQLHSDDPETAKRGEANISVLEKFFLSEWGEYLSDYKGAIIVERLRREREDKDSKCNGAKHVL